MPHATRLTRLAAALVAALPLVVAPLTPAAAQQPPAGRALRVSARFAAAPPQTGAAAFVARLGNDTVAVERFTRRGDVIRGVSVVRTPRTLLRRYQLKLRPDGAPASLRVEIAPPGGARLETSEWTWRGDTVFGSFRRDTVHRSWTVPVTGAPVPFDATLYVAWDVAVRRLGRGSSLTMLANRQVLRYAVQRRPDGAAVLHYPGRDPSYEGVVLRSDLLGLTELDLTATTDRYLVRRVPTFDVEALAADFARRELAGKGLGVLSPRDTALGTVGTAHVLIDYSRPATRGRTVFGGLLVPFGQVWRTGADAASQLSTDRDLEIGGTLVPAGTYSLFSIPTASGWTLILNRQHGQWGTDYDPSRDLARIPLRVRTLPAPLERFTIAFEPGLLRLAWADREGTVALKAK
ncbi:MAG TPA: DUF2911 domain-containing protein [Longimicrobiales bacterium]